MSRHGFENIEKFKEALLRVPLYSAQDPSFFTWARAIMSRSAPRRMRRTSVHIETVWEDLDIMDDEGWAFPGWHPRMRAEMITALVQLYTSIDDGVDWAALETVIDP
jgi:hypothetical protein